jgi:MFS family permease
LLPVVARAPYSLLLSLLFIRFADEWFTFFPAGALEPMRSELDLPYAQVGLILASLSAGGLLGHGFSVAADYVDRRLLASGGAFVYGLCLVGFAVGHSFWFLVAVGVIWGAASDAFIAGCEVTLVRLYPEHLAPVLGRINAYGAVGDLLGPLTLAGAALVGISWRGVFAMGGTLMLAYAAILLIQKFPNVPLVPEAPPPVAAIAAVLRDSQIIRLALVDALFSLLDEPFQGYTIAFFERVRGQPPALATVIVAGWVIAGVVGFLAVPVFSKRSSARSLLLGFGVTIAVAVVIIVIAPFVSLQAIAALVFGFGAAVFYAVLQATVLGIQPERAGTVGAVVSTIGLLGLAFPTLVGSVADRFGLTAGLLLYAAVSPLMLVLLVSGSTPKPGPTTRA